MILITKMYSEQKMTSKVVDDSQSCTNSHCLNEKNKFSFCGTSLLCDLVQGNYRSMCLLARVCGHLTLTLIQLTDSNNNKSPQPLMSQTQDWFNHYELYKVIHNITKLHNSVRFQFMVKLSVFTISQFGSLRQKVTDFSMIWTHSCNWTCTVKLTCKDTRTERLQQLYISVG